MQAVVCPTFGPVEQLRIEICPEPEPGPGQVAIAVEAAGVNFVDALFVQGDYQIKPPTPFVPGSEVAGRIVALGGGVTDRSVGQRVLASCGLGGFAEKVVVAASAAIPIPDALDAPRAATFCQSFSTAAFTLRERAPIEAGQTVLVLGAGGGVGLAMIQLAKALGARTIGAASTAEKRDAATAAGAEAAIDSSHGGDHLKTAAREFAGGQLDMVIDPIGGDLAEPALRALGEAGRYCIIGFAAGTIPRLPANQILLRNRTVIGVDWGAWAMRHADAQATLLADLLVMVDAGSLAPVAPSIFPLADTASVLRALLDRKITGKAALLP